MRLLYTLIAALLAYGIGSLSFAVIVSRMMGLKDPRSYGSGNPGATNVLRSGSKKAAVLTLVLDALKGYLPVMAVAEFGDLVGLGDTALVLVALAAFAGHLWPVFFKFKGGKGVATAAGVLLGLNLLLGIATLAIWGVIAFFTRYASLAAIVAAVFAPVYYLLVWGTDTVAAAIMLMSGVLVWRHRANIQKLLAGTESKIAVSAAPPAKPQPKRPASPSHKQHKQGAPKP